MDHWICVKFCYTTDKMDKDIYDFLKAAFSNEALSWRTAFERYICFKSDQELWDIHCSIHLSTPLIQINTLNAMLFSEWWLTAQQTMEDTGISAG
jgi:hypothetical protein